MVIKCHENSYAHKYAQNNNLSFILINDEESSGDVDGDGQLTDMDIAHILKKISNPAYTFIASDAEANNYVEDIVASGMAVITAGSNVTDDENGVMKVSGKNDLNVISSETSPVTIDGVMYLTYLQTDAQNTDNAVITTANGTVLGNSDTYIAFDFTGKKEGKLSVKCRVKYGKAVALSTGSVENGFTAQEFVDNSATSSDYAASEGVTKDHEDEDNGVYCTLTVPISDGETISFIGTGTNTPIYSIEFIPDTLDFTSADVNGDRKYDILDAIEISKIVAYTVKPNIPSETSGYKFVAEGTEADETVKYHAGDVLFSDDDAVATAYQDLKLRDIAAYPITIGDTTYEHAIAPVGDNTELSVDGGEAKNYRIAFGIKANKDVTVKVDVKVDPGKTVYLLDSDTGSANSVAAISTPTATEGGMTQQTTLKADVKAGQTVYFAGLRTNAYVYGIDASVAK